MGDREEPTVHRRFRRMAVAALLACLAIAAPALGAFPGNPPADPTDIQTGEEGPRDNTPNDPDFDQCEGDESEAGGDAPGQNGEDDDCDSYFSEQFEAFGFNPDSAKNPAQSDLTENPDGRTLYEDCTQLDDAGKEANESAGDPECAQIAGVRADSAWKYSTGSPNVTVAILDTGIEWQEPELVDKVRLNRGELPVPNNNGDPLRAGIDCDADYVGSGEDGYDLNDDEAVNVADYACDDRVKKDAGDEESDDILDASDLIGTAAFTGSSSPDDANGYADDIAGWDFFDDDNDPFDASSCCSATGHGTGRALEAVRETNDKRGKAGMCPECQVMPLRVWDTFVVDTNLYALGALYATRNDADVVEGAVGGLLNTQFARRVFREADQKGVALTLVSSDINSANHNYPTNYNEAIYVAGSLPDTAPNESCEAPGFPGIGDVPVPDQFQEGCEQFLDFVTGIPGFPDVVSGQPPTTSFFRNSNLTQYGGKSDIVLMGSTGSANTGQASGAAGLLKSYAREGGIDLELSGNEVRQLLTMTAEDPRGNFDDPPGESNTGRIGLPDKANLGWDPHFGYGRVNLAAAMERIRDKRIPPEVQLDAPDWFTPINVDKVGAGGVPIKGRVKARFSDVKWELQYACGQDAKDSQFQRIGETHEGEQPSGSELGRLPKSLLEFLAEDCKGEVANDAGRPAGRSLADQPVNWPEDPYPEPDPERHAFQIRLKAWETNDVTNEGQYRKTLFSYKDDGTLSGWPKPIGSGSDPASYITGSGGETSPRFFDLDKDNRLDIILPTTSGEIRVLKANGQPLPTWNGGQPVRTLPYAIAEDHPDAGFGAVGGAPREAPRVPAIGDITGDGEPDIVVTAGEHVYAWNRKGAPIPGFGPGARLDPALSEPCAGGPTAKPCFDEGDRFITHENHIKRGFFGSPALANLDDDRQLEVVTGALDQHLYAFDHDGDYLPGFPKRLDKGDPEEGPRDGAEIVTSPAIANLDGEGPPEIVIATNEQIPGDPDFPDEFNPANFLSLLIGSGTGTNPVYAVKANGDLVDNWPVEIGVLAGDVLPLVVPSHDAAIGDLDPDKPGDEVSVSAATGPAMLVDSEGSAISTYQPVAGNASGVFDQTLQLNLADYPSIGKLSEAPGSKPLVVKGGLSLNGAANLLAVNQNLPFNHSVQAWDPTAQDTNSDLAPYQPGYPVATDDFQLLSQPIIAKVNGSGSDRQALVGTGLYQLHAYGPNGEEPNGRPGVKDDWPKFTGGWTQPMPSVGDVNDDGKLDVMALTREGWSFVWSTDAPTCRTDDDVETNDEWWTFHHDEHSWANYGHDARIPSRPEGLSAVRSGADVRLSFGGSGDDLKCGDARRYEVRGSNSPIESGADFVEAEPLTVSSSPSAADAGGPVSLVAEDGARFRYIAVRAVDDQGNVSYVRATTAQDGGTTPPPPGDGTDGGDDTGGGDDDGGDDGAGAGGGAGGGDEGGAGAIDDRGAGAGGEGDGATGDLDRDGGDLPFTGLGLVLMAAVALALLSGGVLLRRRARR